MINIKARMIVGWKIKLMRVWLLDIAKIVQEENVIQTADILYDCRLIYFGIINILYPRYITSFI